MLDVKFIRENSEAVKEGIAKKKADPKLVDSFLRLDEEWRTKVAAIDQLRSEHNLNNNELAKHRTDDLISKAEILKKQLTKLEEEEKDIKEHRQAKLNLIPNLPQTDVPLGKDESENQVIKEVGEKPKFDFDPKDYLSLAEKLGIIDIKRAAKVSGSRFGYLLGTAALLEFALINFALKRLLDENYISKIIKKNNLNVSNKVFTPVIPPVLINRKSMWGMGYLDQGADEIYHLEKDDLYLVGTAEQSLGTMHQDESFKESELPKRYVGFSTCFRREAGSYGKDTKGILRVHQFNKLEMFSFAAPETSEEEHKLFLAVEEALMQELEIPYRVMKICAGDLGAPAAAKFDIETWFPGENIYRETHSTSNCTDYQARRLNVRYKDKTGKTNFVHTVNGTVFSQRPILAIIENNQTREGGVSIPKSLAPYFDKSN
ncbi:serine--tRNA ligase [Candidatus Jorgensenbacteria bacterium RIFCSPLOWO2_12_FULL_42_11]|uniref:Serine--tRNA ligase n=1 Tax=Candidatus Jorgensenbacteria bacterium RIFCSPLOWO2_12_FULL_42_11 TaxID=1798473 RepID=A0A1F6C1F9_9BACT|nr:MAG: serine--tRNA ligase [Candidatus Jorgensenbacteria bacterium RIFCSPLOWO2_12_FULL_42_11]